MKLKQVIKSTPLLHPAIVAGKDKIEQARYLFEKYRRSKKYGRIPSGPEQETLENLRRDGYVIIKNAVKKEWLLDIYNEFEQSLDQGQNLSTINMDSARKPGDRDGAKINLSKEEISQGQAYFRNNTNYVSANEPLVTIPSVSRIAFHEPFTRFASLYFGCPPAIGGINLRKSYANSLTEFDTLYFRCDYNSPDFIKYFFYLNDVDFEGAPFCFIRGSHRNRFKGYQSKGSYSYEVMLGYYPKEDIISITADVGDLIIANTTGFHRGTKVKSKDRSMLTLDWVIYPEYWGTGSQVKIKRELLQNLDPQQKILTAFLHPIENDESLNVIAQRDY